MNLDESNLTKYSRRLLHQAIIFIASMYKFLSLIFLFLCSVNEPLFAQQIKGLVQGRDEKNPLANVQLVNVYNNHTVFTDSLGNFTINASRGELIEIRYAGYNLTRFRISKGNVPSFLKFILIK